MVFYSSFWNEHYNNQDFTEKSGRVNALIFEKVGGELQKKYDFIYFFRKSREVSAPRKPSYLLTSMNATVLVAEKTI